MKKRTRNVNTTYIKENFIDKIKKKFGRTTMMVIVITAVLTGVFVKAFSLQVVQHDYYAQSAISSAYKVVEQNAPRGKIIDSIGTVFADSEIRYALTFDGTNYKFDTKEGKYENLFNETMIKVFQRLKEIQLSEGEENENLIDDNFELKMNPLRFEFNAVDDDGKIQKEFTFKNDVGLTDYYAKKMFEKSYETLSSTDADDKEKEEKKLVDDKVKKVTAEETFNYLLKLYKIPDTYDLETKRNLIIIRTNLRFQSFSGGKTVNIVTDLSEEAKLTFDQLAKGISIESSGFDVDELSGKFIGLSVTSSHKRVYPQNSLAAPIIGYTSKVSDKNYEDLGYNISSDYVGIAGIEQAFEEYLKGSKGATIHEVNKANENKADIADITEYPGHTVKLTINSNIQRVMEESLKANLEKAQKNYKDSSQNATRGASVAMEVNTGKIIAMASYPTYNPNDFVATNGLSQDKYELYYGTDYEKIAQDMGWSQDKIERMFPKDSDGNRMDFYDYLPKYMMNYATQSQIPPGSIFKIITAYAIQDLGVTPWYTITDKGYYNDEQGYEKSFKDDGANGETNLYWAIEKSSNPYFMDTAGIILDKVKSDDELKNSLNIDSSLDVISSYAWKFGLGVNPKDESAYTGTGIEIAENPGNVADNSVRVKQYQYSVKLNLIESFKNGEYYVKQGNLIKNTLKFTPFDLTFYEEKDSEVLKIAKQDFRDYVDSIVDSGLSLTYNSPENQKKVKELIDNVVKNDKERYRDAEFTDKDYLNISEAVLNEGFYNGYRQANARYNIYNTAIGQGDNNITPLQITSTFATMFNGGKRLKATLLDEIIDAEGNRVYKQNPEIINTVEINNTAINNIKTGMYNMVNSDNYKEYFKDLTYKVGGKTGSATFRDDQLELGRNAFAWMMNVYPLDNPEIVVVSVMFDAHWGRNSIPINADILKAYAEEKAK